MAAALISLPLVVVDAFASAAFRGNPAAVVDFGGEAFLSDDVLQAVAREVNLAETAFVRRVDGAAPRFHLRWFTPESEINLCGHATLATAHALFASGAAPASDGAVLTFESRSGPLTVTRLPGGDLELDFPSWPPAEVAVAELPAALLEAFGLARADILWAGRNRDVTLVLRSPAAVAAARVDLRALDRVEGATVVILAAAGDGAHHLPAANGPAPDFVSRAFCPGCAAVPEDPVCGSAHCSLIPVFAARLGRAEMLAHQLSRRGGELRCRLFSGGGGGGGGAGAAGGDRVKIAGSAVTFLEGRIRVPAALGGAPKA